MVTLKLKYTTESSNLDIIQEYRKQYSSVLHCAYNLRFNNISEKDTEHQLKTLNNISLIGSFLKRCAVKHATQLLENKSDKPMIFGGKKNFLQRCKGKISKEEFQQKRLSKLYIIGEVNNLKDAYYKLKNAKSRYRVSLDDLNHLEFSRCFSNKSKVKKILINNK